MQATASQGIRRLRETMNPLAALIVGGTSVPFLLEDRENQHVAGKRKKTSNYTEINIYREEESVCVCQSKANEGKPNVCIYVDCVVQTPSLSHTITLSLINFLSLSVHCVLGRGHTKEPKLRNIIILRIIRCCPLRQTNAARTVFTKKTSW